MMVLRLLIYWHCLIAGIAHDRGRGMLIAVNKWDLIEKDNNTVKEYTKKIRNILSFMPYAEIIFISAETGQRIPRLFDELEIIIQNHSLRVATGVQQFFSNYTFIQGFSIRCQSHKLIISGINLKSAKICKGTI